MGLRNGYDIRHSVFEPVFPFLCSHTIKHSPQYFLKGMMKDLIQGFGPQLIEALNIAENAKLSAPKVAVHNVVIAGMGGSGIGGNLIKALTSDEISVPIEVSKSYDIPGFVNENTLFIGCSFSGNTEETLAAADKAKAKGAQIVAITSGGKMGEFVSANGYDSISIPGRSNSPRASIGYSFVQILLILKHYGLIPTNHFDEVKSSSALLEKEQSSIQAKAKELTAHFKNKLPIIYGDTKMEAVLVRAQQQIAENSKQLSHVNVIPEMNHNELVGWDHAKVIFANAATLLVRTSYDHPRTSIRMDVCKGIFQKVAGNVLELSGKGSSFLEECMYINHVLDWTSFFLAEENGVDPFPVDVINFLKNELAKVG
jgi:glucose/mannose-6-phosphate isomerase